MPFQIDAIESPAHALAPIKPNNLLFIGKMSTKCSVFLIVAPDISKTSRLLKQITNLKVWLKWPAENGFYDD
jgi:hypothetical protein